MRKAVFLTLTAVLFAIACQTPPTVSDNSANTAAVPKEDWDAYVSKFLDDYFAANPTFAVYQGKHEYDGKFPDWSNEGLAKEIARLKAERQKVTAFKEADLDERQRFERDYVLAQIDKDLFWQETV